MSIPREAGGHRCAARDPRRGEVLRRATADGCVPPVRGDLTPDRVAALIRALSPGGQIAQLVEHLTENQGVGGSIPPLATI
jgi:hypothetical protein